MGKIDRDSITSDLLKLGVQAGDNLVITSSMSQLGYTEGGVHDLLEGILAAVGSDGNMFGLSFTPVYKLPLSKDDRLKVFRRDTPTITGALNSLMLQHPNAIRSSHPICSFVGIGPKAKEILDDHSGEGLAYEPVRRLAMYSNSKMALLGTITNCPGVTTVHVAQNLLNLKYKTRDRYGVNFQDIKGNIDLYTRNYVGGCSRGFGKFYDHYRKRGALSEGRVGDADSMLANLKLTLEVDLEILSKNPEFFLCDDPLCYSCRVTWEFSKRSRFAFKLSRMIAKLKPGRIPQDGF